MDDRDIWRSAKLYIDRYGKDAKIQAGFRADACLDQGDLDGATVWRRVIQVVEELENETPGSVH